MSDHDERGGFGCLTAPDNGIPFAMSSQIGDRATCSCGRRWVVQEVAGFVVWQPEKKES
jgi:hypothetical protein